MTDPHPQTGIRMGELPLKVRRHCGQPVTRDTIHTEPADA